MVTLRQLRYLDALARTRHFGRAAEECTVTQPALSQQIRSLEEELGVVLVDRLPGRVALTPDGEEVVRRARTILGAAQDLVDYARHNARVLSGPLRLGAIPSVAPYLLPGALPRIQANYPQLDLHLRETQTETLVRELIDGRLDAVLAALPLGNRDLEVEPLFEDRFLFASAAEARPDAPPASVGEAVEGRRLLLLEEGHCLRDQTLAYCDAARAGAVDSFGASSLATIMQMVANGYGVTMLPEICARVEARDERIALTRFCAPEPHRVIGLAWRRSSPRRKDFLELGKVLAAVGREATAGAVGTA